MCNKSQCAVAISSTPKSSNRPQSSMTDQRAVGLLSLPRELRDKIYTYLLSAEYVKCARNQLSLKSRRCAYSYRFHTSILCANKQIHDEASYTFYMSNLFVHIYSDTDPVSDLYSRYWPSIPARVQHSPRHAMKVEILFDGQPLNHRTKPQFIITCNDLPAFCRSLLCQKRFFSGSSPFIALRLMIRDEVSTHGSMIEEDEAIEIHETTDTSPAAGDISIEERSRRTHGKSGITSPRVRRLLEPFRQLHSIRDPHIIGPLSKGYKAEMEGEMSKPLPKNHHVFEHMLTVFRAAMDNFGYIKYGLSVLELKTTLDELHIAWRPDIARNMIIKGPYAGFTTGEAYMTMIFTTQMKLAWASVKSGDFHYAQVWRTSVLPQFMGNDWEWENAPPRGFKIGMVFYLQCQLIQGCPHIDCDGHTPSYYLEDAVRALKRGLSYEPANQLLVAELKGTELKLLWEMEVEMLTKMAETLDLECL